MLCALLQAVFVVILMAVILLQTRRFITVAAALGRGGAQAGGLVLEGEGLAACGCAGGAPHHLPSGLQGGLTCSLVCAGGQPAHGVRGSTVAQVVRGGGGRHRCLWDLGAQDLPRHWQLICCG